MSELQHVVDGSFFPGMVSTNPSAPILIAAEHAVTKILAMPLAKKVCSFGFRVEKSADFGNSMSNVVVSTT